MRIFTFELYQWFHLKFQILETVVVIDQVFPDDEIVVIGEGIEELVTFFEFNHCRDPYTDTATDNNEVFVALIPVVKNDFSLLVALYRHLPKSILEDPKLVSPCLAISLVIFSL
jgi:hypothetical protein